ncbi:MAG TPA: translation initiation factor IF-2 [Anaerolineales bacterium]|nr:translation initiation factor IF-2 [Anaerolineales bacterium]
MSDNGARVVELPSSVTVRDLAAKIKASPIDVIKSLMSNGVMANINQQLDFDTAALIAGDLGYEAKPEVTEVAEAEAVEQDTRPEWKRLLEREDAKDMVARPPVVTILGHVDHGKTSLLDVIRKANVAAGEAGGITQHIGAYQVQREGRTITFLDTPGHEAFTAMRARGAQSTDIAILVVAADDGVMPQTREAAAHAKAAQVPILVALNKIDKPNANPERVKQQLAEIGLTPDDWGGNIMVVPVSAKQKTGIDDLLEAILLTADDLPTIKANPTASATGTVLEAELDKSRGVQATLLVQNGTLHAGDVIVAGTAFGKIRAMVNEKGKPIREAGPSTPVSVIGLNEVPVAGDPYIVVGTDREARTIVGERKLAVREAKSEAVKPTSLDQIFARFKAGEAKELVLIVKADVQGSLEPIVNSLNKLSAEGDGPKVNVLYAETGAITENDVNLAVASNAIILGFNVAPENAASRVADTQGISIRQYQVIYRLIEDVEKALKGLLGPEYKPMTIGKAEVRAVFKIPKIGLIAGCVLREGEARRNAKVRVHRGNKVEHEGEVGSLKREKDDVREVKQTGMEFGVGVKDYEAVKVGDILEFFVIQQVN